MIGRMIRAYGTDDVARRKFKKLRFQMIADIPADGGNRSA
jgi:hypothetical protein